MDRVEAASIFILGLIFPIGGLIFSALRRQTRPEVLQRILLVVVAVSVVLQIVNYSLDFSPIRNSIVVATLFVMISVGVPAGLGYALLLRRRQIARSPGQSHGY